MKKTKKACLNLFEEEYKKFQKNCKEKYSNASREFNLFMIRELQKEGVEKCS